jgi:hypothetical protein
MIDASTSSHLNIKPGGKYKFWKCNWKLGKLEGEKGISSAPKATLI